MTVLDKIKIIAKRKGWSSLQTLAEDAGIGSTSIYRWDKKTPSTTSLQKVANALHVPLSELIDTSEDNPAIDIENDKLLSYRGRPIPDDYLDIIKNLMDSDIERGKRRG